MSPAFAGFNSTHRALVQGIISSNGALRSCIQPNAFNKLFSEFCTGALFTALMGAMAYFVSNIASVRVPPQIEEVIVPVVSIVMAALAVFWLRADEGLQNHMMKIVRLALCVIRKIDGFSSVSARMDAFKSFGFKRSDSAFVRDLVDFLVTKNRTPLFHGVNGGIYRPRWQY